MKRFDLEAAVIGAGAAGCCAALRLAADRRETILLEQGSGPPRRFCGEFLAGEAQVTLETLGALDLVSAVSPSTIRRSEIFSARRSFQMTLARPGLGLTRAALDAALLERATASGVEVMTGCAVRAVEPLDGGAGHRIVAKAGEEDIEIRARAVIGAWGKRSPLDRELRRGFLRRASPWVGVKLHFDGAAVNDAVALYLFPGGHCGFVNVEAGRSTFALLARASALRRAGGRPLDLVRFAKRSNAALAERLSGAAAVPGSLLTIAQVPLRLKEPVSGGIFLAGDAAGITAPFLGLGVANALRSGVFAAETAAASLQGSYSAVEALARYEEWWRRTIGASQRWSFAVSALLSSGRACDAALMVASRFPAVVEMIYRSSRGTDWRGRSAAALERS